MKHKKLWLWCRWDETVLNWISPQVRRLLWAAGTHIWACRDENLMTAVEHSSGGSGHSRSDWLISLSCDQSPPLSTPILPCFARPSVLFSPLTQPPARSQTPSWQIAFTLLHFRIITRRCHPEKLTITTALKFNSSISSMSGNTNGKNGANNSTKCKKKTSVALQIFQ